MINDSPALGLERVKDHLTGMGAKALTLYKWPCFERRLASRLRIHGINSVDQYADLLDRDPAERAKLLSALAIGVTSFFRNPSAWLALGGLLKRPGHRVTGWSAGCSTGEEAYSLAMLLAGLHQTGSIGPWSVLGTDVDERCLTVARQGDYPGRSITELDPPGNAIVRDLESTATGVRFGRGLRDRVEFRRDDLTASVIRARFDVVICRNVLIYFGNEGQAKVMDTLLGAIEPNGLLMLGKAEMAAAGPDQRLQLVDRAERIYRRIG